MAGFKAALEKVTKAPPLLVIFHMSGVWDDLPEGWEDHLGEHEAGAKCLHQRRASLREVHILIQILFLHLQNLDGQATKQDR